MRNAPNRAPTIPFESARKRSLHVALTAILIAAAILLSGATASANTPTIRLFPTTVVEDLKQTLEAERINAEHVIRMVFRLLAGRFRELNDAVLRERGDDIDDLSRRLLLSLAGIHAHSLENLPANTVLVARRLLPSDTVFLSRSSTVAVLAEFAGPAAHAALLARELGIPCVGGIPDLLETIHTGEVVLVDGTTGAVVINPSRQALQKHNKTFDEVSKRRETMACVNTVEQTVSTIICHSAAVGMCQPAGAILRASFTAYQLYKQP